MYINKLKNYKFLYATIVILFAILAGTRKAGFDYPEYIIMFFNLMRYDSLLEKILYAKDPILGIIVGITEPSSSDYYESAFLAFSLLTAFFNILVIRKIKTPWQLSTYIITYLLFFYPSLDYAGIRAGLAFPLMMLSMIYFEQRKYKYSVMFGMLAISSHFSALAGIICFLLVFFRGTQYLRYLLIPVIILIASQSPVILSLFKQTATYQINYGSFYSYISPLLTVVALFIFDRYILIDKKGLSRNLIITSLILACFCLGFSQVNVVVALRLLQLSHYIFLCSICFSYEIIPKSHLLKATCLLFIVTPLIMRNSLSVNLWEPLIYHIINLPYIIFY